MDGLLVIVPCGQQKIWDKNPSAGAVLASDAYTGSLFKVGRQYAERFAERWVILSAKFGFVRPAFRIPGPYNVTFRTKATNPVQLERLLQQAKELRLFGFKLVVGLGGKDYREIVQAVFAHTTSEPRFPFERLPIGTMVRAIKQAVESDDPLRQGREDGYDALLEGLDRRMLTEVKPTQEDALWTNLPTKKKTSTRLSRS